MPWQCNHVQVKIYASQLVISVGKTNVQKYVYQEKYSGFEYLPNVTQIISDVAKCLAAPLGLLSLEWNLFILQCMENYDALQYPRDIVASFSYITACYSFILLHVYLRTWKMMAESLGEAPNLLFQAINSALWSNRSFCSHPHGHCHLALVTLHLVFLHLGGEWGSQFWYETLKGKLKRLEPFS